MPPGTASTLCNHRYSSQFGQGIQHLKLLGIPDFALTVFIMFSTVVCLLLFFTMPSRLIIIFPTLIFIVLMLPCWWGSAWQVVRVMMSLCCSWGYLEVLNPTPALLPCLQKWKAITPLSPHYDWMSDIGKVSRSLHWRLTKPITVLTRYFSGRHTLQTRIPFDDPWILVLVNIGWNIRSGASSHHDDYIRVYKTRILRQAIFVFLQAFTSSHQH